MPTLQELEDHLHPVEQSKMLVDEAYAKVRQFKTPSELSANEALVRQIVGSLPSQIEALWPDGHGLVNHYEYDFWRQKGFIHPTAPVRLTAQCFKSASKHIYAALRDQHQHAKSMLNGARKERQRSFRQRRIGI